MPSGNCHSYPSGGHKEVTPMLPGGSECWCSEWLQETWAVPTTNASLPKSQWLQPWVWLSSHHFASMHEIVIDKIRYKPSLTIWPLFICQPPGFQPEVGLTWGLTKGFSEHVLSIWKMYFLIYYQSLPVAFIPPFLSPSCLLLLIITHSGAPNPQRPKWRAVKDIIFVRYVHVWCVCRV